MTSHPPSGRSPDPVLSRATGLVGIDAPRVWPASSRDDASLDGALVALPADGSPGLVRYVTAWSVEPAPEGGLPQALLADVVLRDAAGDPWRGRFRIHFGTLWSVHLATEHWYSDGRLPEGEYAPRRPGILRPNETLHPLLGAFEAQIEDRSDSYVSIIGCDRRKAGVMQLVHVRTKLFGIRVRVDEIIGVNRRGGTSVRHLFQIETLTDADGFVTFDADGTPSLGGKSLSELSPFVATATLPAPFSHPLTEPFRRVQEGAWRALRQTSRWSDADLDAALPMNATVRFRPLA